MLYLWEMPEHPNKYTAVYDQKLSTNRFLLMEGTEVSIKAYSRCDAYLRSADLEDLADDPFIRFQLRPARHSAYIFSTEALYFCAAGTVTKVKISTDDLNKLKTSCAFTESDLDQGPKALTDQQMETLASVKGCPPFSLIPILHLSVSKEKIQKLFDCIPNNSAAPLVNQRIIDLLLQLAPDDVQFFDAEIRCVDGVIRDYKLLNFTHKIIGIDHENSIYTKIYQSKAILGFQYLTYKPSCMGKHKLARDSEYLGNCLVTEEIKNAFEVAKIKGIRFVKPEDYYRNVYGKI